ncbi:MAG: SGNH/GDSL hydrolase family protein [Holophagales bacterium]|nr:SGNH/GDSL hydrolase family protein [Holophagales bacterium]
MRSVLLALLVLIAAARGSSEPQQGRDPLVPQSPPALSVLFVGNSLTFVNDVPGLVQKLAASSTVQARLTVHSVTSGGARLEDHWRKGEAARALRKRRPDVLVIQGQSTEPLNRATDFTRYARLLKAEADAVGARTILLQTWARPAGDPFYTRPASGGSPAAMQARLNEAYDSLALSLNVDVARVGEAFSLVQQQSPEISLLDGSQHATRAGSYLAAAVVFRALYRSSPVGASFSAGLPQATASTLQRAADAVPQGIP